MKISCHTQTLPVAQLLSPSYSLLVCPSSCLEGREKWGGEQNFVLQSNMIHLYWGRSISRPLIDQLLPLVLFLVDVRLWLSLANTCNSPFLPLFFIFVWERGIFFCFRCGPCLLRFIYSCNILPDMFSHPSFKLMMRKSRQYLSSCQVQTSLEMFIFWFDWGPQGRTTPPWFGEFNRLTPTHFPTAPSTLKSWEYLR